MAKFFNILAASVGSGLVLGASIRLGEALGSKLKAGMAEPVQPLRPSPTFRSSPPLRPSPPAARRYNNPVSPALLTRLDHLEEKMSRAFSQFDEPVAANAVPAPEWESVVSGVVARIDRQQADMDAIRQQVSKATRTLDSMGDMASHLRSDLQNELSRNLDERLAAVEARVHLRMEAAHGETLDAMENRVTPRILRMEGEIAGQTAAVSELRECALQSERSVQRLIGVLERIVSPAQSDSRPPRQDGGPGTPFAGGREAAPAGAPTRMPSSFAVLNPIS